MTVKINDNGTGVQVSGDVLIQLFPDIDEILRLAAENFIDTTDIKRTLQGNVLTTILLDDRASVGEVQSSGTEPTYDIDVRVGGSVDSKGAFKPDAKVNIVRHNITHSSSGDAMDVYALVHADVQRAGEETVFAIKGALKEFAAEE